MAKTKLKKKDLELLKEPHQRLKNIVAYFLDHFSDVEQKKQISGQKFSELINAANGLIVVIERMLVETEPKQGLADEESKAHSKKSADRMTSKKEGSKTKSKSKKSKTEKSAR